MNRRRLIRFGLVLAVVIASGILNGCSEDKPPDPGIKWEGKTTGYENTTKAPATSKP
jgi:hypothetical protein